MAQAPLNSLATGEPERSTVVEPPAAHGSYPLTFAQESLWFIEHLAPGTATYNLPEAWVLKGSLNGEALQRALDEIVCRHEVLRTAFRTADGKPAQFVLPSARIELAITDLSSRHQPATELRQLLQAEAEKPFDLGRAPLARGSLFHLGAEEHVLLLNLHHIISDAWSQALLIRELVEIYSALVAGRSFCLPTLPIQYADFALWQRELFASEAGLRHRAYWQELLSKLPGPTLLTGDFPRPARRSFRGSTQFYRIPAALTNELKELSRREGVTLFMTLLAAFKTLLHRYTGNERIVVGSPMACRERLELERLLGFFVHTQVLESDLSGDPPFRELLGRIRETVLQASAHQEVPCQLAWQSQLAQRSSAGEALFEVVFGFQSASPHNWTAEGITAEKMELDTRTAKFDWTVLATESPAGLELRSEFNTELFEASTMSLLMKRFQVLLESIVASPHTTLSRLPLQSEAEREQLLVAWNRTESPYERDLDIHRIFEARVTDAPEAVALSFEGETVSYAELNRRANQLGRRLQTLGVRPGARVGLCLERSCELIVAMLSIVKAGAAYVPLEPHEPRERLESMLRDSGASVVLTQSAYASSLSCTGLIVVCLDQIQSDLASENAENLSSRCQPTHAAYVMYTSGSTGAPKGTLIPHRAIARLVRNTNYLDFSADQVFLQLAPISFDASTFEIWGALLNGARLVLFPAQIPTLEQLARTLRDRGVTVLWLTAGLFHQMVEHQLEALAGLKYLLAGGDVLSPAHVAKAV
ncbi:MAG TPA: condensation domain-containing protein, partial [Verrucomicrobiae bacterium]|nr:condensation domain-containing protein [Verrucomicrobiae bacterium]